MHIIGVDQAILGVEDVDAARRFYDDFGLSRVESGASGAIFRTADHCEVALRALDDTSLPATTAPGSNIREMIWAVDDAAELQKIGAELSRDREVRIDEAGTLHTLDDDGFAIGFRLTRRRAFPPGRDTLNIFGAKPNRAPNERIDYTAPVNPVSLAHVVLWCADIPRAMKFYVGRLGFRVSDIFQGDNGVFLRAAGSSDHHTLFLIRHPERLTRMHHMAFHVTDFNEVMMGGMRLTAKGWETAVGPGRHIVGSNYFWYFKTPCGGAMEYSADMDRATDEWQAREWEFGPKTFYAWTTAYGGTPTPVSAQR